MKPPQPPKDALPVKLTLPRTRHTHPRQRLFTRLDVDLPRGGVWISAPPGAGKTTLLASYIAVQQRRCLWYQIDSGDADVASFYYYLALAADHHGKPGHPNLPSFAPEYAAGIEVFARRYFESLYTRLHPGTLLVFDNLQQVDESSALPSLLALALEQLPTTLGMVLISRSPPWTALARLHVHQQLTHLQYRDLRLEPAEALAIATVHDGAPLSTARQASVLAAHAQVDGWVAGLTLLMAHPNTVLDSDLRTQEPTLLFNYFATEVFDRMPAETQALLPPLAVPPHASGELADALTGSPKGQAVLEELHQRNYFTVRQENTAAYQFHPLFRGFLLNRAQRTLGDTGLRALRQRAATCLELTNSQELALLTFIEAED
jgi:LuxR family transcriptional regulator, maltose regulon positive regulatory protein